MEKRTPPPLPTSNKGSRANDPGQNGMPSATREQASAEDSGLTTAPDKDTVDPDFDTQRKNRLRLWIIPSLIILLLAGGGVYAYFYMKEKEEKARRELLDKKEEEESRRQAMADSIAAAEQIRALNDSLRLNFTTPDLNFLGLKGHVASVHTKVGYTDGNIDVLCMLINETTIEYDYDGTFTDLAGNLDRFGNSRPSVSRNSDGMVTGVSYHYDYGSDSYTLSWSGNHLSSIKDSSGGSTWSQSNSGGSYSCPSSASFSYRNDCGSSATLNFRFSYSDFDEYGNWRKANVSASGSNTYETQEWDEYWGEWNTRTKTDNMNYTYTIERFINYHEYRPIGDTAVSE